MDEPRRQCTSEVDWLCTNIDCSGGQWHPKNAPEDVVGSNNIGGYQGMGPTNNNFGSNESVIDCCLDDSNSNEESLSSSESEKISATMITSQIFTFQIMILVHIQTVTLKKDALLSIMMQNPHKTQILTNCLMMIPF